MAKKTGFLVPALLLCAFAFLALPSGAVSAQDPQPTPSADEVNSVASQLYCPVCENISLDVCPTQACAQWRDLIALKLSDGWTADQIKDYFVQQYGPSVLAEPVFPWWSVISIAAPLLVFVTGGVAFWRLRRGNRAAQTARPAASAEPASDPYLTQLEQELRKREED